MSAPTLADGNWLERVIPTSPELRALEPRRCAHHNFAQWRCESAVSAPDPDKAATIARCQATRLGWLVAVLAYGISEEHSPQAVCTSGPSCSRLPEPARLGFLRVQYSS